MIGDLYISVTPKNRNKWRLKKTDYPKDVILFEGSKYQCEQEKIKYHEKSNGTRLPKSSAVS